jgi:hypothetical protein
MRVTRIFTLFIFFVYRHSDLEGSCSNGTQTSHVNLVVSCVPHGVTRSDIGLYDLKHLRKVIVERMMGVLVSSGSMVVRLSPCFRGGVWGEKYCSSRCVSNLYF